MQNKTQSENDIRLKIELDKIELEKERLIFEREKFKQDRANIKIALFSAFIPLLIAALSLGYNFWQEKQRADLEFQLKAAEIIMNTTSPTGSYNRAKALIDLFPDRLPATLLESFSPAKYTATVDVDAKNKVIALIIENEDKKDEIIYMYKKIFPSYIWLDDLK